jgi:hypothetical protein
MNKLLIFLFLLQSQDKLIFENPFFHLGKIKSNSEVVVEFKVINRNTHDIRIYSVTSTCGCTIPLYPKSIPSKKSIIIKAIFRPEHMRGLVKKELVLLTDDQTKYYKLEFDAEIY